MVTAMPASGNHRLLLRIAVALSVGVVLIVALRVIPQVRFDPLATREVAIRAFWLYVGIPQIFIAATLLIISFFIRPGRRALNLASGVVGPMALALIVVLLDAGKAFLGHGPGMRGASIALFVCAGLDILIGIIAVKVAISRHLEAGQVALVLIFSSLSLFQACSDRGAQTSRLGHLNVLDFGAVGDGKTDDTASFQKALDTAGERGGGVVAAPRGNYLFAGHLNVPSAVNLTGQWESVPAHNGLRDPGLPKPTADGTTFLVTEGAGREDGAAFITLNTNSTLKGVVLYYPEQNADDVPKPYPWAIAMRGKNPAVLAVEMLNPYNGIEATQNERHLIRDVSGQPLRRGLLVDSIYDIGRIENVHFNPWWSVKPKLFEWQMANGEAFIFGRSDWQYVFNTFCFGYKVGYRFIRTEAGVCNGNFLGIGADDCHTALVVEDCAPYGLLITNGEFVSFRGPDPTMVEVQGTNRGNVRFVNGAFWGPCNQIARIAGAGTVGFSDCTFVEWGGAEGNRPAIQAQAGTLLVRGCEFRQDRPQIELGADVARAIIVENILTGRERILNRSNGTVQIGLNVGN